MKKCTKCEQLLPLTLFYFMKSNGRLMAECKTCLKKRVSKLQLQDLYKENKRKHYEKNIERYKELDKKRVNKLEPGIYMIKNQITGEKYIGQSKTPWRRKSNHFSKLSKNDNQISPPLLQKDMQQYGKQSFMFGIIEHCPPGQLLEREQYYINLFKPEYNEHNTTT